MIRILLNKCPVLIGPPEDVQSILGVAVLVAVALKLLLYQELFRCEPNRTSKPEFDTHVVLVSNFVSNTRLAQVWFLWKCCEGCCSFKVSERRRSSVVPHYRTRHHRIRKVGCVFVNPCSDQICIKVGLLVSARRGFLLLEVVRLFWRYFLLHKDVQFDSSYLTALILVVTSLTERSALDACQELRIRWTPVMF